MENEKEMTPAEFYEQVMIQLNKYKQNHQEFKEAIDEFITTIDQIQDTNEEL